MPTTPNGTPYGLYSHVVSGQGTVRWGVGLDAAAGTDIPTILYAHGAGGTSDQFQSLTAWAGLRNWLIDNGWAWVEGSGAASGGSQNWGNDAARIAYPAYLEYVETVLDIGTVVLLGRSMGGLVTAWLYAQYSGRARFSGWINNSGVSTMLVGSDDPDDPSIEKNTGAYFTTACWNAYGADTYADWAAAVGDHAPETWDPSVWAGLNILACYGTDDMTVPWSPRGASALRDLWAGQPAIDSVAVRTGGDHTTANGSYYEVDAMTAFLVAINGDNPPVHQPTIYRRIAAYILLGGERYPVTATAHTL